MHGSDITIHFIKINGIWIITNIGKITFKSAIHINPEIIVRMFMAHVESMFNPRLFPLGSFKLSEIYTTGYLYHLHGISSAKGHDLIKDKFKHIKNTY